MLTEPNSRPCRAAVRANDTLWSTVGHLLNQFNPTEHCDYLASCEYEFRKSEMLLEILRIASYSSYHYEELEDREDVEMGEDQEV